MDQQKEKGDFEVLDTEEYRSPEDQQFSHQSLVMIASKKALEYGCQELIHGYYSTQENNKGQTKIIYKQDTRKAFIESVRTLRMVMICDFDTDAKNKLIASKVGEENEKENLIDKLKLLKETWLGKQKEWYDNLNEGQKHQIINKGINVIDGYFNTVLPFGEQYLLDELEIYREIFEELTLLTERKDFFKSERAEA